MSSNHQYYAFKCMPTVFPYEPFDADADAAALKEAMKGLGTNEDAIIDILAKRTILQRTAIAEAFQELCDKDLETELKSELHHHFEDVVLALMTPLPQLYAKSLHRAVHGPGTDESTLVEVLMSLSNFGIVDVANEYQRMYGCPLEKDIKGDTSGDFRNLLVTMCSATRDEGDVVVEDAVRDDALALADVGASQWANEESLFTAILASRSFPHLRLMFRVYKSITSKDIEDVIEEEFSGDLKNGLLDIVRIVYSRTGYFAKRLYDSMKGPGTRDHTLIRIVVSRSEIDLADIKREFLALFGKTLESWISGDTTGHYKKMLLTLVA